MTPQVAHVTIFGRELPRMIEFYHDTLGLPLIATDDAMHYALVDGGSVRIGLGAGEPSPEVKVQIGGLTGIGFAVPDVDVAYESLKAKGVRFSLPPKRHPWGAYMGMFLDPDDNILYLQAAAEG